MSVKLGVAFLFVFFFACNCSEKSQAEELEKQEDVGVDSQGPFEKDDDGHVEEEGVDVGDDETARDAIAKEEGVHGSRHIDRKKRSEDPRWSGWHNYYTCALRRSASFHKYIYRCGRRTYDSRCHLCCGNTLVYKRGRYLSCCKGHAYDFRSCVCRRGRVRCRRPNSNRPKPRLKPGPKPGPEPGGPVTPV